MRGPSGHLLRIFVSSPDYNLRDLRAELCDFLTRLGYQPILSSESGFPDLTPRMTPWESCLEVLSTCPIMVLVIDSRYGSALPWPSFVKQIGPAALSPTHAEYRFARHLRVRMLVYVRESMLAHHDAYHAVEKRLTRKDNGTTTRPTTSEICAALSLPDHVQFEAVRFFAEVKREQPIPWIQPFHDVVDLKADLQQRLTNEIAEVLLVKQGHLQLIVARLSKALEDLPPEKRVEALQGFGFNKELILEQEARLAESKTQLDQKQRELATAQTEVLELQTAKKEGTQEIKAAVALVGQLKVQLRDKESKLLAVRRANADAIIEGSGAGATFGPGPIRPFFGHGVTLSASGKEVCSKCGSAYGGLDLAAVGGLTCHACSRTYCQNCWGTPVNVGPNLFEASCPGCGVSHVVVR